MKKIDFLNLQELIKLRRILHQYPEVSGQEKETAKRIKQFIKQHHDTKIIENIGGYGLAAVYNFPEHGPTVMIRCELDALPIIEKNTFAHQSKNSGVSHKCGHDGHMTIVAGLIFWIKEQSFKSGKIILLFQPSEETGKGAFEMLQDDQFKSLTPDFVFALHNIPNESLHRIIWIPKTFSAEVQSLKIDLIGKESHAAEPEQGINPSKAISEIIDELNTLNISDPLLENFSLLTPVHISMGQKSYGISPGKGELHYTIRTWSKQHLASLKAKITDHVSTISHLHKLDFKIEWFEHFPATNNDPICNEIIQKVAIKQNFELSKKSFPFKFGEDFGWFGRQYKAAMFGLGSGLNTPALHHADYDFPEEILETGIQMFCEIIKEILN